jgi:GNAT superfamily N-acetyltransferase
VRAYERRGLVPRFHLHAAVEPADLDAFLARLGWPRELGALAQVRDLEASPPGPLPGGRTFRPEEVPSREWLAAFAAWRGLTRESLAAHEAILARIEPDHVFASVGDAEGPRAVGLATAAEGQVGLFDLVTDPLARRQGWGRALVEGLVGWGRQAGATSAFLQVQDDNDPALRLYAGLGFKTAYAYGYRMAPGG